MKIDDTEYLGLSIDQNGYYIIVIKKQGNEFKKEDELYFGMFNKAFYSFSSLHLSLGCESFPFYLSFARLESIIKDLEAISLFLQGIVDFDSVTFNNKIITFKRVYKAKLNERVSFEINGKEYFVKNYGHLVTDSDIDSIKMIRECKILTNDIKDLLSTENRSLITFYFKLLMNDHITVERFKEVANGLVYHESFDKEQGLVK